MAADDAGVTSTATEFPPCPACGSRDALEIIYGLPGIDLWEAEVRGEVALGGCTVGPESPDYECRGCGAPLPWVRRDD